MFAVIVESHERRSGAPGSPVMTRAGDKFLVVEDLPDRWVVATSTNYREGMDFPLHTKLFNTKEDADKFAQEWDGHPWWCKPNGVYKIIEIEPLYEPRLKGYRVIE